MVKSQYFSAKAHVVPDPCVVKAGGQSMLRWAVPQCQSDLVRSELLCSYYSGNSQKLQNNQISLHNSKIFI